MKRRRSDPQATRYRVAVTALAKAEKRERDAARAATELRRKIKGYERRLPPERIAEINAGTAAAKASKKAQQERWREAERTLLTAARVQGMPGSVEVVFALKNASLKNFKKTKAGLAVQLREGMALIWRSREGYLTGRWADRNNRSRLSKPTESDPLAYLMAAE
jgi:uncharacterized membrane protein YsdA (DUF1294 family)